ncbi:MAG: hypothetical protein U0175_09015 [Caldilineaceae bacterium]
MKLYFAQNASAVHWRRYALFLSLLYFVAACVSPALLMRSRIQYGLELLVGGWLAVLFRLNFAWLANPCYFAALICFIHWRRGAKIVYSSLALFFALLTLRLFSNPIGEMGGLLVGFGAGFYFWMISILILFYAALADTKTGDAFFRYTLPKVRLGERSFPSALLVTLLLSLPAITVGGWYLSKSYISYREYQEYRRNHPIQINYAATSEAVAKSESISLVGGSDSAIDWNQDGQLDVVYISMNLAGVEPGNYYWSASMTADKQSGSYSEKKIYSEEGDGWFDTSTPITMSVPANYMTRVNHNGTYRVHLQLVQNWDDSEKRTIYYIQGEYITKPYNSRQFLPVDRGERPPLDSSK